MEARELSLLQSRAAEKLIPSIFPGHGWPGAVIGSLTEGADEDWFTVRYCVGLMTAAAG